VVGSGQRRVGRSRKGWILAKVCPPASKLKGVRRRKRLVTFAPRGLQGERVTSGYRTPARNAAVGGVAGSYHTKRGSNGQPMARDSIPPKGMGMAAYANLLRRQNPDLQVINEGDHVHLEPKGRK
jgi:Peptidase M15